MTETVNQAEEKSIKTTMMVDGREYATTTWGRYPNPFN